MKKGQRAVPSKRSASSTDEPPQLSLSRVLIVPDCHHPNVDEVAWNLMLRVARDFKPHTLVLLGDFLDGESLSLHDPDEPSLHDFEYELDAVRKAMDELDSLGAEKKIFVEGNHEQRLSRYLARRAPALYSSMKLQEILKLHETGWTWVPYRKSIKVGKLHITHDTGSAGMNAHRASAKAFMGSTVIGHTHRLAYEAVGRFDGVPYLACMLGWLGDSEKAAKYLHEAKSAEWVHGFGLGYAEPSGVTHVTPVPIVGGKCVVEGRLYF